MKKFVLLITLLSCGVATNVCYAIDCVTLDAWSANQVYVGGDRVRHDSRAYQANWWTLNQNPTTHSNAWQEWTLLGVCDGGGGGNQPPVADANGPYTAIEDETVHFSSVGSNDIDGSIVNYSWSFGDGANSSQASPSHSYMVAGTYTVTLTVTDNDGASTTASTVVTVTTDTGGGGGGDCAGVPAYVAGAQYALGDRVANVLDSTGESVEFECLVGGWCSSSATWAYAPGNGLHWTDAWLRIGPCGGGGGNQAPVADANGPYRGTVGIAISFTSNGSFDADGSIVGYSWNFGDGGTSNRASPIHAYASSGSYTVTLTVNDDEGASTTTSTVASVSSPGSNALPHRVLVGYWHNFINGAGYTPLSEVNDAWDIVNIAFAENAPGGAAGVVAFAPAEESEQNFQAAVGGLQARGKKVLISLGGANAHLQLNSASARDNFVSSMGDIIARYGFDGMDIDLEGGSLNMTGGDTIANPRTPAIVNLIAATRSLKARFGPSFVLTMAPETAYVQGGYATFGGIWGAYLPLIHALRDDLTVLHVQHYNTGSITGADDNVYGPASVDFHVAMSDMLITGFPAGRDQGNFFRGLRADQIAIGLPANGNAASSGFTSSTIVHRALDCLIRLASCGSYRPARAHVDFRGLMTWSINWDRHSGFSFSAPHRGYIDQNP